VGKRHAGRATLTPAAQRLRDALAAMLNQDAGGASPKALSAKALCERAGISRNALYRYHPDILRVLYKAQRRHRESARVAKRPLRQLQADNDALREHLAKLAALVDHYFAAWQESQLRLQRCERELADVRRTITPRVVSIRERAPQ